MEIALALHVHDNPPIVRDTIDSIRAFVTHNIVVVVDGLGWKQFADFKHPDTIIVKGKDHGARKSPYKNVAVGFQSLYENFPNADWYSSVEYDLLFLSSDFKKDLQAALSGNISAAGIEHNISPEVGSIWLLKDIFPDVEWNQRHKMLGCFMFFSNKCVRGWVESGFLDKLLELTKHYSGEQFPNFNDYAVEEVLFPSAASLFGEVRNLSTLTTNYYNKYLVRFAPQIGPNEVHSGISVVHPVKDINDPIRKHYSEFRKLILQQC